ncbi:MAG: NAD-dependent succinate-semialdehyde dehydrogenase [Gammaproteobacteria bacterium]|nr:NAD-dependent succinate-semialdehyde dehydrogenase [Gammaproteobacteria bacterium]
MSRETVFTSIDPYSGEPLASYAEMSPGQVDAAIEQARKAQRDWVRRPLRERAECLLSLGRRLREGCERYAARMAGEMGKVAREGRAEVEKCARACEFFAEHGERWLRSEPVKTEALISRVEYPPLGLVFAIMPWNFPFWQVLRFGIPALIAGNGIVLKHAPNVFGSALDLEALFREAGFPEGLVRALLIDTTQVAGIIEDPRVAAVTVTGSVRVGRIVAALAGQALKKSVLELGGSDPFVVLDDADIEQAAAAAVASRFQNCGQSCIAAKRLIVDESLRPAFEQALIERIGALRCGDPVREDTDLGPLARGDLRDGLHRQVEASRRAGARVVLGGALPAGPGFRYPPTLLTGVDPGSPACREELFGPVAVLIGVRNETEAIRMANATEYGLAASVWTADPDRGGRVAAEIEAGAVFVNRVPFSDPRLPFGGVRQSGYGRELSRLGLLEFCAPRSVWVERA